MTGVVILALAAFTLTWLIGFWPGTDAIRSRLGIGYVLNGQGEVVDREAGGRVGEWFNCPQCVGLVAGGLVVILHWLGLPWAIIEGLAAIGLLQLVIRWWEGARVKTEWWI